MGLHAVSLMTIRQCSWCSLQLFWGGFLFCCEGVIVKKKRAHTHVCVATCIYIVFPANCVQTCKLAWAVLYDWNHKYVFSLPLSCMLGRLLCMCGHFSTLWEGLSICTCVLMLNCLCICVCFLWYPWTAMCTPLSFCVSVCAQVCICAPAHSHISVTARPLWTRVLSKILTHRWVLITHIPQD